MSLHGHVFNKQLFSSECFALFIDIFLGKTSGIIQGCELSNTTNTISIGNGYFDIRGRFLEEQGGTDFNIENSKEDTYCKLVCEVDLSQVNTTRELKQAYYKILKSTKEYQELIQEDITKDGTIYQFEFAQFKITTEGIVDFIDKRTYIDFASMYEEIRRDKNQFFIDLKNGTTIKIDKLIKELEQYCEQAQATLEGNVAMNLLNLINTKADKKKTWNITLDTEWEGTEAPYTKTVVVDGILATDIANVYPVWSDSLEIRQTEKEEYSKISLVNSADGSITLIGDEEKPEISLNIRVEVVY